MEIDVWLYLAHPDDSVLEQLTEFFDNEELEEEEFAEFAASVDTERGHKLTNELFAQSSVESYCRQDEFEEEPGGIRSFSFLQGTGGEHQMTHLVGFLHDLIPGLTVQAWGFGDEDPWEFFIKIEDGEVVRREFEPGEDDDRDQRARDTIYEWWHEDMPEGIEVGLLNEDDDDMPEGIEDGPSDEDDENDDEYH
jgi:hypothetical protein